VRRAVRPKGAEERLKRSFYILGVVGGEESRGDICPSDGSKNTKMIPISRDSPGSAEVAEYKKMILAKVKRKAENTSICRLETTTANHQK